MNPFAIDAEGNDWRKIVELIGIHDVVRKIVQHPEFCASMHDENGVRGPQGQVITYYEVKVLWEEAERQQRLALCDSIIFAVTESAGQRLCGRGPSVTSTQQRRIRAI